MEQEIVDIILIEDSPYDVELILRALNSKHLANRVKVLSDGEEALQYLFCTDQYKDQAHSMPVLIMLDYHLPKIDGAEVLRRIKADERTRRIPVVMLTSQEDESLDFNVLGANSYVSKPLLIDDFIRVIGQVGFYWAIINRQPQK